MTALFIALFVLGIIALLERAHRRAGPFDVAPGRTPAPGADRVAADVAAVGDAVEMRCARICSTPTSPTVPRVAA